MKDESILIFMRGQMNAISDLCDGLARGSHTEALVEDLRKKSMQSVSADAEGKEYGTGYELILSLASVVSSFQSNLASFNK